MALSAEESKKLLDAIQNLNVSAEVIQEVLQLIRNAGHTGAVDIAEHDNDPDAHVNVPNLCRLINGSLYLGTRGSVGNVYWANLFPVAIAKAIGGNVWSARVNAETSGKDYFCRYGSYLAETTEDGGAVSIEDLESSYSGARRTVSLDGCRHTSDFLEEDSGIMNIFTGYTGCSTRSGKMDCASWRLGGHVNKGSSSTWFYEFGPDAIFPWGGINASLGLSSNPFDNAYLKNAATVTSDVRLKKSIEDLNGEKALAFLKALRPVTYSMQVGKTEVIRADKEGNPVEIKTIPGSRRHSGFIAQEVKKALEGAGEDPTENALWCLENPSDSDSIQMIRYEELIAPMLKVIQMQQERIEALEAKLK